jgi:hypothetical protein
MFRSGVAAGSLDKSGSAYADCSLRTSLLFLLCFPKLFESHPLSDAAHELHIGCVPEPRPPTDCPWVICNVLRLSAMIESDQRLLANWKGCIQDA